MSKPSRLDYAYAVGRVRSLEKKLVSRSDFVEAAEEKDFSDAIKVIYDAGYFPDEMIEIKDSLDLDNFLEREESGLRALMSEILQEERLQLILLEENQPSEALVHVSDREYPFICDYLKHRIDLGNLKVFCRAKYLDLSPYTFGSLVMKGGFLDENIWLANYNLTFGEMGEKLQASSYREVWNRATDALEEKETFIVLEREVENFLMIYLKRAKYIVFGPEPVFSYALAKKRELQLIRLLGVAKIHRITPEIIKERMSETYV